MGEESCFYEKVRASVNFNSEIKEMIARCETCRKFAASQPGTLILVETPSNSWEKIGVDLFSFNNKNFPIKQHPG